MQGGRGECQQSQKMGGVLAFDLETYTLPSPRWPHECKDAGGQPLFITCIAFNWRDADGSAHNWTLHGNPSRPRPMPRKMVEEAVHFLVEKHRQGYTIVTWNGANFDFRVLAALVRSHPTLCAEIADVARGHVDLAYLFLCRHGFMVGLDAAAQAIGMPPKLMSGKDAPAVWQNGSEADRKVVLEYVQWDAYSTLVVYDNVVSTGSLAFRSRGHMQCLPMVEAGGTALTVELASQCVSRPPREWKKVPRSHCVGWLDIPPYPLPISPVPAVGHDHSTTASS